MKYSFLCVVDKERMRELVKFINRQKKIMFKNDFSFEPFLNTNKEKNEHFHVN